MPLLGVTAVIMRKRHMELVKKMPSEEFTIHWKEIALIGKGGGQVICNYKPYHTANGGNIWAAYWNGGRTSVSHKPV